ncbi:MAG: methyltransferase domain-containing protein [Pseudomonadota bacterium]
MPRIEDRVQRSFSRSFSSYHAAADQQVRIADLLVHQLRNNGAPRYFASALELGCGTGHLTKRLQDGFSFGLLTLNDLAPEARQTAHAASARFLGGDARQVAWPERPQLIASASMIQWLRDPLDLLRKAATALAPGGWLAVSGFGPDQYCELTRLGSSAGAPGLCRAADLAAAVRHELKVVATGETHHRARFDSPRDVLDHMRKTGVNGQARQTWTKTRLAQFCADYTRMFQDQAGLPLTYHAVWIIARKCG